MISHNSSDDFEESKNEDNTVDEEVLIGALISQVKLGKDDIIEIHNHDMQ